MLELLTPLGLLGLLSLVVLLIIYLIRPNFQIKRISSTYIWKLSLRYRRKRIPISKLRNLLIILCQIIALTTCAFILAQPNKHYETNKNAGECVIVVDSSASMLTEHEGTTRFQRAITKVGEDYKKMVETGVMSLIIADSNPYYAFSDKTKSPEDVMFVEDVLLRLQEQDCSYGESDINAAMEICEETLIDNPEAKIILYTDVNYSYIPKNIEVRRNEVINSAEMNVGILDARAEYEDNFYAFYIDVSVYGYTETALETNIEIEVQGANEYENNGGFNYRFDEFVTVANGDVSTVVFKYFYDDYEYEEYMQMIDENTVVYRIPEDKRIFSYRNVHVSHNNFDSFYLDDNFDIYGGQKDTLKVMYRSTAPNTFVNSVMYVLQSMMSENWTIDFKEIRPGTQDVPSEGYDMYIYEHMVPEVVPEDGVVLFLDPLSPLPESLGVQLVQMMQTTGVPVNNTLSTHPIMKNVVTENITVSMATMATYDEFWDILMDMEGMPILAARNDYATKVVVMPFSLHYSNIAILPELTILMRNMFDYFIPPMVEKNAFEVEERIRVQCRGSNLSITNSLDERTEITDNPAEFELTIPGTYRLEQNTFSGATDDEYIYVRIPKNESNIWIVEDTFANPYSQDLNLDYYKDLLLYIAIILVSALFLEWLLHLKEER